MCTVALFAERTSLRAAAFEHTHLSERKLEACARTVAATSELGRAPP
jgi:hypothetical protein